jgi:hypothetical protein
MTRYFESLRDRLTGDVVRASNLSVQNLLDMLAVLATLPSVQDEVAYIQTVVNSLASESADILR